MSTQAVMTLAAGDPLVSNTYQLQNMQTTNGFGQAYGGGYIAGGYCSGCYHFPCTCHHSIQYVMTTAYTIPDKTKVAFSVAKKLLKSKFIKADKIQEFVELVEMIEKEL